MKYLLKFEIILRKLKKGDFFVYTIAYQNQDALGANVKFSYPMVCKKITEAVSDTESKPLNESTYNTGTGNFPGKMILHPIISSPSTKLVPAVISSLIPKYAEKSKKLFQI